MMINGSSVNYFEMESCIGFEASKKFTKANSVVCRSCDSFCVLSFEIGSGLAFALIEKPIL
jgi:hypothetical protein